MHQIDDSARRRELAEFLRSRRDRLSPEAAGLRSGARRRTPGLRREEVAELAGIGTAWYTWLEQARDIRPSEGALRQIARALQLDEPEKRYLLELGLERAPRKRVEEEVSPFLRRLLDGIDTPAFVKGQRWDLLAYNEAADAVFDYSHVPDTNLLRMMFRPENKRFLPNWEHIARQHVAIFRTENAGLLKDPWVMQLVDELKSDSPEFARWWSEHAVSEQKSGHKTYHHPFAGPLEFDFGVLVPEDGPNLRIVMYVATDEETKERMAELRKRHPPGLWEALAAER